MKKIIVFSIFLLSIFSAFSQQDVKAKEVLDKLSQKTKTYKTIKIEFSTTIENLAKKTKETNTGSVFMKATKYKVNFLNTELYCDGKTIWSYLKEAQEVNIKNASDEDNSVLNPAKIFTIYNEGFKYQYLGEKTENGKNVHEIDLFPIKSGEKNYSRVKLVIDKDNLQIVSIKTIGKDGINYTINVTKFTADQNMDDNIFIYDEKAHKGVEVIDLRD